MTVVIGIDTGVGKTVAAVLAVAARRVGRSRARNGAPRSDEADGSVGPPAASSVLMNVVSIERSRSGEAAAS